MLRHLWPALPTVTVAIALTAHGAAQGPGNAQRPTRDRPAVTAAQPSGTGRIAGRVVAADTGRPVRRVRVLLTSSELPSGGRGASTDDQGQFDFQTLPAGRYTLVASKSGLISFAKSIGRAAGAGSLAICSGVIFEGAAAAPAGRRRTGRTPGRTAPTRWSRPRS